MNVIIFSPIGLFIKFGFRNISFCKVAGMGLFLSLFIEAIQFSFMRGFAEIDDMIHNTLGSMVGYGIAQILNFEYKRIKQNQRECH